MSKPLVIYHANCADGFGAAFAAWLSLGDEAEYVPMSYGEQPLDFEGREVYILDFSFPRETMARIFANASRVVCLDHHKTAFETMYPGHDYLVHGVINQHSQNKYVELNNWKSGAMLAWEYFHPGTEVPRLIQHIDDYDRWQFKIEGTKAFNKALWSYAPWSFEQWKELNRQLETYDDHGGDFPHFIFKEGEAILRAHDQNVQSVVKGSARACAFAANLGRINYPFDDDPVEEIFTGLSANCPPHLTSDVGHALATQSRTFGLCWHLGKEGTMAKCSLRSNGEYDVSAIAKVFGGGGHLRAAGFEVPIEVLLSWVK